MTRLEDLQPHASVRGLLPDALATVVSVPLPRQITAVYEAMLQRRTLRFASQGFERE